jgi:hypothetical protein
MRAGRLKAYIAVVDAGGVTYEYVIHAGRHIDAEKEAREAAGQQGTTLVEIRPAIEWRGRTRRRQGIVLGVTIALTALLIVRESLGGVF